MVDSQAFNFLDSHLAELLENEFSQTQDTTIKGEVGDTSVKWSVKYKRFKLDDLISPSHFKLCKTPSAQF